jgi:cytochrome c peroxidase
MKKFIVALFLFTQAGIACRLEYGETPALQIHRYVDDGIDSLSNWINVGFLQLVKTGSDSILLRQEFFRGRALYKRIEFAIEYFFTDAARKINGPPLPEIEPEEHMVLDPGGFQVIEEYLFPFDADHRKELLVEAGKLKSMLVRIKTLWEGTQIRDDQVFDALRFECFRVICLGISGFDTQLSLHGIHEIPGALHSVKTILSFYKTRNNQNRKEYLDRAIDSAIRYASTKPDFENFNRIVFIRDFINPITTRLLDLQKILKVPVISNNYALRSDVKTIFDSAAFNINYFAPDANSFATTENIKLGGQLFKDPILSESNKISCASCHHPEKAFTDGFVKSRALGSNGLLSRNTPSVINAGLQKAQFYDMRATFLEDQVRNVVESKDEIHGSLAKAVIRLRSDTNYIRAFQIAFPQIKEGINERLIQIALSCYIRSLTSFQSRFDHYMRGDDSKMNQEEVKGFNLFMGKAKCGTCHFMPLFSGTVPPGFTFTESEVIGVPGETDGRTLDQDPGRYGVYKIENFRNAFKTPTIRNIALTAPYMHNGVFVSLEEVIKFYDSGGGNGIGLQVNNQTLPSDSLHLTAAEKQALIVFMQALTDSSVITKIE